MLTRPPPDCFRARSGNVWSLYQAGVMMYTIVVLTVHGQLVVVEDQWTWLHHCATWMSIGALGCCVQGQECGLLRFLGVRQFQEGEREGGCLHPAPCPPPPPDWGFCGWWRLRPPFHILSNLLPACCLATHLPPNKLGASCSCSMAAVPPTITHVAPRTIAAPLQACGSCSWWCMASSLSPCPRICTSS